MSYGPRYYGYLWSKVFAQDLFRTIQHYGLRSKAIGKRYIDEVISKGGSQDPEELMTTFLGRKPSIYQFLNDAGLS